MQKIDREKLMVTSLKEPMSVKFKMWNELAHAVFCARLSLSPV